MTLYHHDPYLVDIYIYIIHCVHCLKPWNQMMLDNKFGRNVTRWAGCVTGFLPPGLATSLPF